MSGDPHAIVVVGHHARRSRAEALAVELRAHLLLDEGAHGASWNHRRALAWAAQQTGPCLVIEDDALPCPGFRAHAARWRERFPRDLLSFYLGTGRPPEWQVRIADALRRADAEGRDHLRLPALLHGVCYALPAGGAAKVQEQLSANPQIDFAIGRAWAQPVVYALPSLVDHADEAPVERHPDGERRDQPRRAWRVAR